MVRGPAQHRRRPGPRTPFARCVRVRRPLVPPLLQHLLEGTPPVKTTTRAEQTDDVAYRAWIGHTTTCAACRAGVACPTAVRLGRAWREARR